MTDKNDKLFQNCDTFSKNTLDTKLFQNCDTFSKNTLDTRTDLLYNNKRIDNLSLGIHTLKGGFRFKFLGRKI